MYSSGVLVLVDYCTRTYPLDHNNFESTVIARIVDVAYQRINLLGHEVWTALLALALYSEGAGNLIQHHERVSVVGRGS